MAKFKFNLIVISSFLLALKVCLIDFGKKVSLYYQFQRPINI